MIVLDTSVVLAFMNRAERQHAAVRDWMHGNHDELATTPPAVAEMDHLATRHGGSAAADALYANLRSGAYRVEWWASATADSLEVLDEHPELGFTDASLVALAAHLQSTRIATLDERHFRRLAPRHGAAAFTLLPADA